MSIKLPKKVIKTVSGCNSNSIFYILEDVLEPYSSRMAGIIAAKENIFSIAERILNMIVSIRYFLYGGTNLRRTCINSFI